MSCNTCENLHTRCAPIRNKHYTASKSRWIWSVKLSHSNINKRYHHQFWSASWLWWLSSNSLPSNRFLQFGWLVSRLQSWAMVLTFAALAFGLIYRSRSLEISRALCDNTPSVVDCCKSNSVSSSAVAASASGLWWSAYSARALYKKNKC